LRRRAQNDIIASESDIMPSGRFILRIPPELHAEIAAQAREAGLSLNAWCARRLAQPVHPGPEEPGAEAVIRRAIEVAGEGLVGVVVYGSWARGEARPGSDIDLAIVLDPEVSPTRALYRAWDEAPPAWDDRVVEPHFVALPAPDAVLGGLWAELALDGWILYERGLDLSRRLVRIRHDLVSGRIVRRVVHGQPYWSAA
jgi:hypothetical protein